MQQHLLLLLLILLSLSLSLFLWPLLLLLPADKISRRDIPKRPGDRAERVELGEQEMLHATATHM